VAALTRALVWMRRDATATNDGRGVVLPPLILIMAVDLLPLGLCMIVRRPEKKRERNCGTNTSDLLDGVVARAHRPQQPVGHRPQVGMLLYRGSRSGRPSLSHSARLIRHPIDEGAVADVTAVP
jgi:hypothetical protein